MQIVPCLQRSGGVFSDREPLVRYSDPVPAIPGRDPQQNLETTSCLFRSCTMGQWSGVLVDPSIGPNVRGHAMRVGGQ